MLAVRRIRDRRYNPAVTNTHVGRFGQPAAAVVVVGPEGLLEPEDVVPPASPSFAESPESNLFGPVLEFFMHPFGPNLWPVADVVGIMEAEKAAPDPLICSLIVSLCDKPIAPGLP
jgi:hypothetical protein